MFVCQAHFSYYGYAFTTLISCILDFKKQYDFFHFFPPCSKINKVYTCFPKFNYMYGNVD